MARRRLNVSKSLCLSGAFGLHTQVSPWRSFAWRLHDGHHFMRRSPTRKRSKNALRHARRSGFLRLLAWACRALPARHTHGKKFWWIRGHSGRRCVEGVCVECIDIDSMRKMAVELGIWQGWQAGLRLKETNSVQCSPSVLFADNGPFFARFCSLAWNANECSDGAFDGNKEA